MVLTFDFTDCLARAPHYNRIRSGTLGAVSNPLQQFTVSNAGCAEEVVVPSDEISSTKDSAQVMPSINCLIALLIIGRPEFSLDFPPEGGHGASGNDPFGRSANPHENVNSSIGPRSHHGTGNVTIDYEFNAGTGFADLTSEIFVPWSI